jgi:hypothetical protein
MRAAACLTAVLLTSQIAPARATAPAPLPYGIWIIAGQTCPGCEGTTIVPDLAGATITISPTTYSDAIIGTDICKGAPVLKTRAQATLNAILAMAPRIEARALRTAFPGNPPASRIDIDCASPVPAPYAGKPLAQIIYVPPSAMLYAWNDNVLLFKKGDQGR